MYTSPPFILEFCLPRSRLCIFQKTPASAFTLARSSGHSRARMSSFQGNLKRFTSSDLFSALPKVLPSWDGVLPTFRTRLNFSIFWNNWWLRYIWFFNVFSNRYILVTLHWQTFLHLAPASLLIALPFRAVPSTWLKTLGSRKTRTHRSGKQQFHNQDLLWQKDVTFLTPN